VSLPNLFDRHLLNASGLDRTAAITMLVGPV